MKFYCPSCRQEHEAEPKETITTKSNRVAYKANCPVCGQDMAEFTEFNQEKVNEVGQELIGQDNPKTVAKTSAIQAAEQPVENVDQVKSPENTVEVNVDQPTQQPVEKLHE